MLYNLTLQKKQTKKHYLFTLKTRFIFIGTDICVFLNPGDGNYLITLQKYTLSI